MDEQPKPVGGRRDVIRPSRVPNFLRPPLHSRQSVNSSSLTFQILSIELYQPNQNGILKGIRRERSYYGQRNQTPPVLLFGVTAEGHSVCVRVQGFRPYIWVQVPSDWDEDNVDQFVSLIVQDDEKEKNVFSDLHRNQWTPTYGFHNNEKFTYLRLEFQSDDLRKDVVRNLWNLLKNSTFADKKIFTPLEYQIPWQLQFFEGRNLETSGWCQIPKFRYQVQNGSDAVSVCQLNATTDYEQLHLHECMDIPPLLVASFDIECFRGANDGKLPNEEVDGDKIIQISTVVQVYGEEKPCYANVYCLDTVSPTKEDYELFTFKTEKELLESWQKFFRRLEPDFLTGYNIFQFDLKYMMGRAVKLEAISFFELGKAYGVETKVKDTGIASRAYASNKWKITPMIGVQLMDLHTIIKREHKLPNYKLNTVARHFLGEQKKEIHYQQIQEYQMLDAEHRRIVADYCWWDSMLPMLLVFHNKIKTIESLVMMSRITKVPIDYLVLRGQSIKVLSQFMHRAHREGYIVTEPPNHKANQDKKRKEEQEDAEYRAKAKEYGMRLPKKKDIKDFSGATVLHPESGFYRIPIPTLDFASLYPSIMIGHNLCYTTLVIDERYANIPGVEYEVSDVKHLETGVVHRNTFVINRPALLPGMLSDLLTERKAVKVQMAAETNPGKKSLLNFRQLNLKISANSIYGFTGASVGSLPEKKIAETVTHFGRQMLEMTKGWIYDHFPKAKVIYGDTDSVMVAFNLEGEDAFERIFTLAPEVAAEISKLFPRPCKLEFEKIYFPMLLYDTKKTYAGMLWLKPDKPEYMDAKGFKMVKRDTCGLVKDTSKEVLKRLMDNDLVGAVNHVQEVLEQIHNDEMPKQQYVVSMMLSRDMDSYDQASAHVELARRMRKRDPNNAPHSGDRIPFVAVDIGDIELKRKLSERIEDPVYAEEHGLLIDRHWYIRHQLQEPIVKLLSLSLKNPDEIFNRAAAKQIRLQSGIDLDKFSAPRKSAPAIDQAQLPGWLKVCTPSNEKARAQQKSIFESLNIAQVAKKLPTAPPKQAPKQPLRTQPLRNQQSMVSFFKKPKK